MAGLGPAGTLSSLVMPTLTRLRAAWRRVTLSDASPEYRGFEMLMQRLQGGAAPDPMGAVETELEHCAGARGFQMMRGPAGDGALSSEAMDPDYFAALHLSQQVLVATARTEEQRQAVDRVMRHIFDAYDLGRGQALAGGERDPSDAPPGTLH